MEVLLFALLVAGEYFFLKCILRRMEKPAVKFSKKATIPVYHDYGRSDAPALYNSSFRYLA